ncbi:Predicted arabinose efflux permease, MFS family [Belnapia rosea]|uniref:Predicted arabinose efflux permease, MFS family n=1 Tax=Belnapia rosea TaxID=938405 RepID=A0A1G7B7D1_9PROT|nr:Predicted arabinose efflux permease, MFS family [Belnapia rosea]SDE23024.1 Predicted arabinose efflux permease, MFS family [Belnapia rosea]
MGTGGAYASRVATGRVTPTRALDVLNVLLSDVRYGLGAYLGVYLLTEHQWDAGEIGLALSIGGLAGLLAQAPIGLLVDAIRAKRALIAGAVLVVMACCLVIPLAPSFWPVTLAGVVGGLAGTSIAPTLAAISLGIVGPERFARRACRNEALFHAGNGAINLLILATAPFFGTPVLFWVMAGTGLASAAAALAIPPRSIDHAVARGLLPGAANVAPRQGWHLLTGSRPLLTFALCGALFHMANGSMLALVAQKLALQNIGWGVALTAICAIAAQVVMVPAATLAGARAESWGRRPLLLAAFLALALRGLLYTAFDHPAWLIGVQLLDGVGAGLIGALFPVVIADLTRGSGHFAAAQGVVGTVHGLGGVVSGALSGLIVVWAGYDAAFLALAATAGLGAALFWLTMPETRPLPLEKEFAHDHSAA